jgi:hypothetical protein
VKPLPNLDVSTTIGVAPLGGDVEPLSRIAAVTDRERAEHFDFTDEDKELLEEVLSQQGGQQNGHTG